MTTRTHEQILRDLRKVLRLTGRETDRYIITVAEADMPKTAMLMAEADAALYQHADAPPAPPNGWTHDKPTVSGYYLRNNPPAYAVVRAQVYEAEGVLKIPGQESLYGIPITSLPNSWWWYGPIPPPPATNAKEETDDK